MSREGNGLGFDACGLVRNGPAVEIRPILNDEIQFSLCDGDGRSGETQNLCLGEGRSGGGVGTRHLFALQRDSFNRVLGARHKRIERHVFACRIGLPALVAIGVGAGDIKCAAFLAGFDLNGQIIGADVCHGDRVNACHRRDNNKEPYCRSNRSQRSCADQNRQNPFWHGRLFLPSLSARRQIDLQFILFAVSIGRGLVCIVLGCVLRILIQIKGNLS